MLICISSVSDWLIPSGMCNMVRSWAITVCSQKEENASCSHVRLETTKAKSFAGNRFDRNDCHTP